LQRVAILLVPRTLFGTSAHRCVLLPTIAFCALRQALRAVRVIMNIFIARTGRAKGWRRLGQHHVKPGHNGSFLPRK
jgi:hypothetical protein